MGTRGRGLLRSPAWRWRTSSLRQTIRNWSIRSKIVSLLLLPLLTLVVMWLFATAVTLGPGLTLLDAQVMIDNVGRPGNALLIEVQRERKLTVAYLAGGRREPASLTAQRTRTDTALATFRQLSDGENVRDAASATARQRLAEFDADLVSLTRLRGEVDRGEIDKAMAMRRYTQLVDSSFSVFGALIGAADEDLTRQSQAALQISRAMEVLAQEDAVITGAIVAGTVTRADLGQAIQLIGAQRFLFASTVADLHVTDRQDYQGLARTDPFAQLTRLEDAIVADARAGAALPVDRTTWPATYGAVDIQLRAFEQRVADGIVERSRPAALALFVRIAIPGLLGLAVVVVTIAASIRIARNLIKRLAGLRQAALELAVDRLPRVVSRLRHGEQVDVAGEAPPLPYGEDEIGQVGHAFNELQRTAINSAVDEANLRQGINEVFLNIARRSQTLLHRQLSILDSMERRIDDPVELEDLFRVDHLATRMRRHAEDLVILAGAAPGRGWRHPIAMIDVLRGAVSEVEDYARVSIRPLPDIGLTGRAVGDVIHLLAELIENATSFSPPHTRVSVGGEFVAHGFAIDIEDRGLGMSQEDIAVLNTRLADPPDFDPTNSAQLGLFVVARLAVRHGIKVTLRSSAYGGITAVALVPEELIETGDFTSRTARARQTVAALPSSPHVDTTPPGSAASNGVAVNGHARGTVYPTQTETQPEGTQPERTQTQSERTQTQPERTQPGRTQPHRAGAARSPIVATSGLVPAQVTPDPPPASTKRPTKPRPRHARSDIIEPPASAGPDGLPRRIRQTSLAPQLREGPPGDEFRAGGDIPTEASPTRSPEELRAMMTSFQAGMVRGRRDAEELDRRASERDQL